jgi:hypothetical protein
MLSEPSFTLIVCAYTILTTIAGNREVQVVLGLKLER